uniref:Uncharacterized protein n=1 Tax=Caenorhabditis japonica TaxID=281687 RepID=A0A8R1DTV1_CAEJA
MQSIVLAALLLSALAITNAFHIPYGTLESRDDFAGPAKRAAYYVGKPFKREFNADDMMLRFGKRAGEPVAFSPDMLSLRFGK